MIRRLLAAAVVLAACATEPGVATESARRIDVASTTEPTEPTEPTEGPTEPSDPTPPSTDAPTEGPDDTTAPPPIEDLFVPGDAKPARAWDDLVRAVLVDLERWWAGEYPALYGDPFEPLGGGVYPAYPERTDPIPGCGGPATTTYEEANLFGAFYCPDGDFLVYDDGEVGTLADLANEFGPIILGVVLAHEYGHVVQARNGTIDQELTTIATEQQADCFAGAWVARAVRGEADGVPFPDEDVRTGLIAMITVRDPVGIDTQSPGGHGSAFDRVGAFQVGYLEGVERCSELIDDPLPLVPNVFNTTNDQATGGNAPFGYDAGEVPGFLVDDLNAYWPDALADVGAELAPLQLVAVQGPEDVSCDDPVGDLALGVLYCPSNAQAVLDETFALDLYERFGDFTVGYLLGSVWSEAAQRALDSGLSGEERALVSDCLTGTWAADLIPTPGGSGPRGVSISPGDLDEAIQTALVVGDEGSGDDVNGSGFEKIASFRRGVLEGLTSCTDQLD